MSLLVTSLGHASSKECGVEMMIGDMDISRLMVYVQKVELRDKEEYRKKKATRTRNEFRQQKGGSSRQQFQKQKGSAQSYASAPSLRNKGEHHGHNSQNIKARPS